ncbi:hypothetical protein M9435_002042 [Picochlorum sp. BPE23]|nr:hypothetical protein M9435_002042 [Picochlorum sp. BPE23]
MFYSTEVLKSTRSALGFVWGAAHGRRLARTKVLQANISEACESILDPEVPQALRLQAILTSGIVLLHKKKVNYLQEDAEHTMKRLCEVDNSSSIEEKKIDLPKSARKAKNITLNRDGEEELATDVFLTFDRSQPAKDFAFEQGLENEYFVLSNTEELGFEGDDASLDNGNYIMDSPDLMPEAYEDMILPGHMDDACMGYDYGVGSIGSPNSVMPPPEQDFVIMERKRKRKGKMDEQISIEPMDGLKEDNLTIRDLNTTLEAPGNSKGTFKSLIRLFSLPISSYHGDNLLSAYLSNHLKVHQDFMRKQHQKKRKRAQDEPEMHEIHDYQGSPQGYDQVYGLAEDDNGLQSGPPRGQQQDAPIEIERLRAALHVTPNQRMYGYHSSSRSFPGSGDMSREDSGLSNSNRSSVQKEKLSDMFEASQYDLDRDMQLHLNLPPAATFSQINNYGLQETGPTMSQSNQYDWDKGSHTYEILTKARMVSTSDTLTLDEITSHLTRHEAATMFHHVLVGVNRGFISAHQGEPYHPVMIEFHF